MSGYIVVNGNKFEIGFPVKLWDQPKGFDGYDTSEFRYSEFDRKTGKEKSFLKSGPRFTGKAFRKDFAQVIVHHTGGYRASTCFNTLHNERGLSVQFIVDDNGLIYQTMDAAEVAWHAGKHNKISVGIEVCLRPQKEDSAYEVPGKFTKHNISVETVHGQRMKRYSFSQDQTSVLPSLIAGIWKGAGHTLAPVAPREGGKIVKTVLANPLGHVGVMGHYHCTLNKVDPANVDWMVLESDIRSEWVVPVATNFKDL